MKPKVKWLDRSIGRVGPRVTLCVSESEYEAAQKALGVNFFEPWLDKGNAETMIFKDQEACIVSINANDEVSAIETACIILHEAVHVWQFFCDYIEEHNPGIEQEAYGIQSIAQKLIEEFSRKTGKNWHLANLRRK